MCIKYKVKFNQLHKSLPIFYPIPKLHKNPYKFRFIAAGRTCTMKPISILLDIILKHMKTHMKNYCNRIFKTNGINCWWTINSTKEFIERASRSQRHNNGLRIFTGDFASMFTSLKQDTILIALNKMTAHCFKNAMNYGGNNYLTITNNRVTYSKTRTEDAINMTKEEVMELIYDQVKNSYVTFAGYIFKQKQGTSMGSNASCSIADCVLIWHEYEYLTKKDNKQKAIKLNNSCRYVDDFCTFANLERNQVLETIKEIYPDELILEITSKDNVTNFLDSSIKIGIDNKIDISVYNKTDVF